MKIESIESLAIEDVKVIKFSKFKDHRGYFTEQFRESDLMENSKIESLKSKKIVQANESYSNSNVIRGLHFQWSPYMGKLVRTLEGRMVDLVLDIRKGSPSFGKLIGYDMPESFSKDTDQWIWVPPGFAHGNYFTEPTKIEYLCTGEYSPGCEAGISPFSKDIDFSLCDRKIYQEFFEVCEKAIITDKDKDAPTISEWENDERSDNFIYSKLKEEKLS